MLAIVYIFVYNAPIEITKRGDSETKRVCKVVEKTRRYNFTSKETSAIEVQR